MFYEFRFCALADVATLIYVNVGTMWGYNELSVGHRLRTTRGWWGTHGWFGLPFSKPTIVGWKIHRWPVHSRCIMLHVLLKGCNFLLQDYCSLLEGNILGPWTTLICIDYHWFTSQLLLTGFLHQLDCSFRRCSQVGSGLHHELWFGYKNKTSKMPMVSEGLVWVLLKHVSCHPAGEEPACCEVVFLL